MNRAMAWLRSWRPASSRPARGDAGPGEAAENADASLAGSVEGAEAAPGDGSAAAPTAELMEARIAEIERAAAEKVAEIEKAAAERVAAAEATAAKAGEARAPALSPLEWDTLMRSASDGGANSILACHVLAKTREMLGVGGSQVEHMLKASNRVGSHTVELRRVTDDIKAIAGQTKIVSINLSIEAARIAGSGRTVDVVAREMQTLSKAVDELTRVIDTKLESVHKETHENEQLCQQVGDLFVRMNRELEQFRNLMLRIQELSTTQGDKLRGLESRLMKPDGGASKAA